MEMLKFIGTTIVTIVVFITALTVVGFIVSAFFDYFFGEHDTDDDEYDMD